MLENLCLNKRKNKSAKFSENLNAFSITPLNSPVVNDAFAITSRSALGVDVAMPDCANK
jgi:hypothetical protein